MRVALRAEVAPPDERSSIDSGWADQRDGHAPLLHRDRVPVLFLTKLSTGLSTPIRIGGERV